MCFLRKWKPFKPALRLEREKGSDKRRRFACLALISVIAPLMLFNLETNKTSSTTIYVEPPTIHAPFLEDFKVDINIENVTDINAWQAKLKWDPQLLDIPS